jgi:hypothetical protein
MRVGELWYSRAGVLSAILGSIFSLFVSIYSCLIMRMHDIRVLGQ